MTIDEASIELEEILDYFKEDLKTIRTGRASATVLEGIQPEYYGVRTPIEQMATISVSDSRSVQIVPWSRDSLVEIEKAIRDSDLNLNPVNDGIAIRLNFPALTEETRKELVKILGKKSEETRIKVRKVRESFLDQVKKKEKEGAISEDEKFNQKEKIQKMVDNYNKKIEDILIKKEEDILKV